MSEYRQNKKRCIGISFYSSSTSLLDGFNPVVRSGDIIIELSPVNYFRLRGADRTTNGTAYSYDTHVPLLKESKLIL